MIEERTIGVDPGTKTTGYGIVEKSSSGLIVIDYGCIRIPTSLSSNERYHCIFKALSHLMERYKPSMMALETQFVFRNAKTAMMLAMARCAAMLAAQEVGGKVFEYTPSTIKKGICGNGHASKQQVQRMVQLLLKLKTIPEPDDAADALALALCHFRRAASILPR